MPQIEEFQKFVDECYKEEPEEQPPADSQLSAKKRELHESAEEEVNTKKRELQKSSQEEAEEASAKVPRVQEDFSDESEEETKKPRPRRLVVSDSDDS